MGLIGALVLAESRSTELTGRMLEFLPDLESGGDLWGLRNVDQCNAGDWLSVGDAIAIARSAVAVGEPAARTCMTRRLEISGQN